MCGILGFMTDKPSAENATYFKRILYLSESRGAEATGICYINKEKPIIEKEPVAASDFIKANLPKHMNSLAKAKIALGHTRYPTQGSPKDNNNNHPLESKNWILIHNGSVTGMTRLNNYEYKGKVDSEVLLSYIEEYGLEKGLPHVGRGTASVAVMNKNELNAVYLWRETNPIVLAYDEDTKTLFFASQEEFLEKSLTNKLVLFSSFRREKLIENLLVKITINPLDVEKLGYITVVRPAYSPINSKSTTVYRQGCSSFGSSLSSGAGARQSTVDPVKMHELVFNNKTFRWEMPTGEWAGTAGASSSVPAIQDTTTESSPLTKVLLVRGFTREEIERMSPSAKSTIVYADFTASDCSIDTDGFIVPHSKELYDRVTRVNQEVKTKGIGEEETTKYGLLGNKFFMQGMSHDFVYWTKLSHPNRGYLSIDGQLIKKWDKDKAAHYLILLEDAIKENLIDRAALEDDIVFLEDGEDEDEMDEIEEATLAHMHEI